MSNDIHRRLNNQACSCGWSAKRAGVSGWMSRAMALDSHIRGHNSVHTCEICKASWTAPVSACPVCTDPAVLDAVQVLTAHGIDGRKYGQLLKLLPDEAPQ